MKNKKTFSTIFWTKQHLHANMQIDEWLNYKQSNKQNDIDFVIIYRFKNFEFERIEFFVIYTIWLIAYMLIS